MSTTWQQKAIEEYRIWCGAQGCVVEEVTPDKDGVQVQHRTPNGTRVRWYTLEGHCIDEKTIAYCRAGETEWREPVWPDEHWSRDEHLLMEDTLQRYRSETTMGKGANPNWRGGHVIASNGYVLIHVGAEHPLADIRGYAYEHRIVAEQKIGRALLEGEQVHHKDGNRQNNHPDNLEVMSSIAHHRMAHRRMGTALRQPDELNEEVACACGCGTMRLKYDNNGRLHTFVSGHNTKSNHPDTQIECGCGCGATFALYSIHGQMRKYLPGHASRKSAPTPNQLILCGCGCGSQLLEKDRSGRTRHFVSGHNRYLELKGRTQ